MWTEVLNALASIKRTTWSLVSQYAQVLDYDGKRLLLGFDSAGRAQSFGRGAHPDFLRQALIDVIGLDCKVEAMASSDFRSGPSISSAPAGGAPPPPPPGRPGPSTGTGPGTGPGAAGNPSGAGRSGAEPTTADLGPALDHPAGGPDRPHRDDRDRSAAGSASGPVPARSTGGSPARRPGRPPFVRPGLALRRHPAVAGRATG
jgi:DNA polymerase-3 subunit gamma/tau